MEIELIQRANKGPVIARVFDKDVCLFVSAAGMCRQTAIDECQEWAVTKFGEEIEVSPEVEILPYTRPNMGPKQYHGCQVRDPAYGKTRPLPATNKDAFCDHSG